jgi:uncharacterized Ntn-hydrolase superfamily protein
MASEAALCQRAVSSTAAATGTAVDRPSAALPAWQAAGGGRQAVQADAAAKAV